MNDEFNIAKFMKSPAEVAREKAHATKMAQLQAISQATLAQQNVGASIGLAPFNGLPNDLAGMLGAMTVQQAVQHDPFPEATLFSRQLIARLPAEMHKLFRAVILNRNMNRYEISLTGGKVIYVPEGRWLDDAMLAQIALEAP